LEGFFAFAPMPFQIFDRQGRSIMVNQAFVDLFGKEPPRDYSILTDPSAEKNGVTKGFHEMLNGEVIQIPSLWFDSPAGPRRRLGLECTGFPVRNAKGEIHYVGFMYRDVTQELLTSEKLAMSESRVDRLMDSDLLGLFRVDLDGRVRDANSAFLKISGYTAQEIADGSINWNTGVPLEYWDVNKKGLKELRDTGLCPTFEKEFLRKDSSRVPVMVGGTMLSSPEDILCFALDMTNLKKLEQQLRQSQKMEAIGQLAGGIAHDFNNILSLILLNVEFLLDDVQEPSVRESIESIRGAADKAARLTKQLLAFARNQVKTAKVLDTKATLADMKQMFQRLLTADIKLDMDLGREIPNVRINRTYMEQILMNLVVNAQDALPTGGTLKVIAECAEEPGRPGKFLHISVADDGVGMEEKIKAQIFEPFFTTKEVGKGTGLGLSTVLGIVKQAGGEVRVESTLGYGSNFHVYIPACDDKVVDDENEIKPKMSDPDEHTLILVEDELDLRRITASFLRRKGFDVLEAGNGEEAREIMKSHSTKVSLIVTDVIMPEKTGPAFIEELKSEGLEPKVLFLSGYSSDELIRHGVSLEETMFLNKPFTTRDLLGKIQEMLVQTSP
jgi:PAS domain S-box-containing protein